MEVEWHPQDHTSFVCQNWSWTATSRAGCPNPCELLCGHARPCAVEVLGRHLQLNYRKSVLDVKEGFSVLKSLFLAALINSFFPWLESSSSAQLSVLSQSVFTQRVMQLKKKARNTQNVSTSVEWSLRIGELSSKWIWDGCLENTFFSFPRWER